MHGDTNISAIASVLADPGRCRVLAALGDGRALPASMLAAEAGVAPSTASEHLSKLVRAGLLTVERHSRHRYFRLAGPDVADLLEALARVAPPSPVRSLREGTRAHALRSATGCPRPAAPSASGSPRRARCSSRSSASTSTPCRRGAPPSATASTGASSARTWPAPSARRSPTACSISAGSGVPSAAAPSTSPTRAARDLPTSSASTRTDQWEASRRGRSATGDQPRLAGCAHPTEFTDALRFDPYRFEVGRVQPFMSLEDHLPIENVRNTEQHWSVGTLQQCSKLSSVEKPKR